MKHYIKSCIGLIELFVMLRKPLLVFAIWITTRPGENVMPTPGPGRAKDLWNPPDTLPECLQ